MYGNLMALFLLTMAVSAESVLHLKNGDSFGDVDSGVRLAYLGYASWETTSLPDIQHRTAENDQCVMDMFQATRHYVERDLHCVLRDTHITHDILSSGYHVMDVMARESPTLLRQWRDTHMFNLSQPLTPHVFEASTRFVGCVCRLLLPMVAPAYAPMLMDAAGDVPVGNSFWVGFSLFNLEQSIPCCSKRILLKYANNRITIQHTLVRDEPTLCDA